MDCRMKGLRIEIWNKTEVEKSIDANGKSSCALIESPKWGDAGFCGKWLLAAAHAEKLWKEACKNPEFDMQVARVCVAYDPDFGIAASVMLRLLKPHKTIFALDLDSAEGDEFAMMAGMGFFSWYSARYRMSIPSNLSIAKVKKAVLSYAATEDEEHELHPEYLVNTRLFSDAMALQKINCD